MRLPPQRGRLAPGAYPTRCRNHTHRHDKESSTPAPVNQVSADGTLSQDGGSRLSNSLYHDAMFVLASCGLVCAAATIQSCQPGEQNQRSEPNSTSTHDALRVALSPSANLMASTETASTLADAILPQALRRITAAAALAAAIFAASLAEAQQIPAQRQGKPPEFPRAPNAAQP